MAWMDHRAAEDAERINAGGHEVLRYVGGALSPEMQTPKLAWLSRTKPETFAKAAHFLGLTDYLSFRATGSLARSLCSVACKFGYLGARAALAARVSGQRRPRRARGERVSPVSARRLSSRERRVGRGLTAEAAAAMGLMPRARRSVRGSIDAHAGALASLGARAGGEPGDPRRRLALILGTSSRCLAVSDEPRFIDAVWGPHLSGLIPGQWLMDGGQSAFGAAIDRLVRMHPAFAGVSARGFDALERAIAARAGGLSQAALLADGLHVLPSFIGERAPFADAGARGGVVGLDLRDDIASLEELYVAGLCGLAYGVADIVAAYERAGYAFDTIVASGGAAPSPLVRQIVADVCGLPGRLAGYAGAGAARLGDDRRRRLGARRR